MERSKVTCCFVDNNFVKSTVKGCYIAHYNAEWIVEVSELNEEEFDMNNIDNLPDISLDPESGLLSVINTHNSLSRSYFITIFDCKAFDNDENEMERGTTFEIVETGEEEGKNLIKKERNCITFILSLLPLTIMDVCYIESYKEENDISDIELYSDIKEIYPHPEPKIWNKNVIIGFPLDSSLSSDQSIYSQDKFLCSQGFNGEFTHFFPGTYHAVDLACNIGTPVVAVSDGVITDIQQHNNSNGIDIRNLFLWNSITLKVTLDKDLDEENQKENHIFVEYVHIKKNSVTVNVGDKVNKGDIICQSGDIGFCPVPHLHIQIHQTDQSNANTILFAFEKLPSNNNDNNANDKEDSNYNNNYFFPVSGKYYNQFGQSI